MIERVLSSRHIKAIIGLGNPGLKFVRTRHNIGFRIVEALAERLGASWKQRGIMEVAEAGVNEQNLLLIKPQTFMNASGQVIAELRQEGIKAEDILIVHDELELPFGKVALRIGGSHRGHNGLKSIFQFAGADVARLRFGIGRPENKDDVPEYVLAPFEQAQEVERLIDEAVDMIMAEL